MRQLSPCPVAVRQVDALEITATMTNETTKEARQTEVLHIFFEMDDGSSIAFFAEPSEPFAFSRQRDFDLHLALEVPMAKLHEMFERGKAAGIETRGISDHGFIDSIYFRDPNGYSHTHARALSVSLCLTLCLTLTLGDCVQVCRRADHADR